MNDVAEQRPARYADLGSIIPDRCFKDPRFCAQPGFDEWEREVAEPQLRKKGWTVLSWHTGDGDSFGPLSRYALCEIRNRQWRLVYG